MPDEVYRRIDLSHVSGLLCGAEPLRLGTVKKFLAKFQPRGLHDWAFKPAYGLAENTLIVSGSPTFATAPRVLFVDSAKLRECNQVVSRDGQALPFKDLKEDDGSTSTSGDNTEWLPLISCGTPRQSIEVSIVDPEIKLELSEGKVGEIWIKSPSLARGYFGCPEETQYTFGNIISRRLPFSAMHREEGYYLRTGDAGFLFDGNLYIVGRIKDMLILRGRNYFPQDIESLVEEVPDLRCGCSACFPLEIAGEERCGLAVEVKETEATLRSGLRARVASVLKGTQFDQSYVEELAKLIRRKVAESLALDIAALWICRPKSLPKTSSGKVRRSLTRESLLSGSMPGAVLLSPPVNLLAQISMPGSRIVRASLTAQAIPADTTDDNTDIAKSQTATMDIVLSSNPAAETSNADAGASFADISNMAAPSTPLSAQSSPLRVSSSNIPSLGSSHQEPSTEPAAKKGDSSVPQERRTFVRQCIVEAAKDSIGVEGFDEDVFDRPLFELGVDSIGAITFIEALGSLVGRQLDTTLLFEFPTLSDIEDFLCDDTAKMEMPAQSAVAAAVPNAPLFIFGAACRFPGSSKLLPVGLDTSVSTSQGLEDFWTNLYAGIDAITEVPLDRWNIDAYWTSHTEPLQAGKIYTRGGGFIEDAEWFDHAAFRLAPREAQQMDPQQRLALECCSEAIWHSGLTEQRVKHRRIGTYFGCCSSDWSRLRPIQALHSGTSGAKKAESAEVREQKSISVYTSAAYAPSLIANRVSFVFGLTGPSVVIDTACSSSLVALDSAAHHLRDGKCEGALVGGVNMMLTPEVPSMLCKANMLSRDSRCKTFDVRADGYSRGEGVGCIFISPDINLTHKLLTTTTASPKLSRPSSGMDTRGDPQDLPLPLAIIRGVAVNHGGVAAALTAPNVAAHQELLGAALVRARINPRDVEFVETHGTGTKLGDPVELAAIRAVYGRGRAFEFPLVLGAVKTQVGHLEGAAGIAGVLKSIAVLQRKAVPCNLHLRELNPQLPIEGLPVLFPKETYSLSENRDRHFACVSSFGFGGTNAHALLQRFETAGMSDVAAPPRKIWKRVAAPFRRLIPPMLGCVEEDTDIFSVTTHLRTDVTQLLAEHIIQEVPVVPAAALLELVREVHHAYCRYALGHTETTTCQIASLDIERPVILSEITHDGPPKGLPPLTLNASLKKASGQFSLSAKYLDDALSNAVHNASSLSAKISLGTERLSAPTQCSYKESQPGPEDVAVSVAEFYKMTKTVGLSLGPRFQTITALWRRPLIDPDKAAFLASISHVETASRLIRGSQFERAFFLHPAMLDAAMQLSALTVASCRPQSGVQTFYVPVRMEGVWMDSFPIGDTLRCVAVCSRKGDRDGDVRISLFSETGAKCVMHINKLVMAHVSFSVPVDIPRLCLWTSPLECLDITDSPSDSSVADPDRWALLTFETPSDSTAARDKLITLLPTELMLLQLPVTFDSQNNEAKHLFSRIVINFDSCSLNELPIVAIRTLTQFVSSCKQGATSNALVFLLSTEPSHFRTLAALRKSVEYEWLTAGLGFKPVSLNISPPVCRISAETLSRICYSINRGDPELWLLPAPEEKIQPSMKTAPASLEEAPETTVPIPISLKVPRLQSVSSDRIVGSLLEVSLDLDPGGKVRSLRCRPFSRATRRLPKPTEVEVAVKSFAFQCQPLQRHATNLSVSNSFFGTNKVYFSGVVCRDCQSASKHYAVGARVTGVWDDSVSRPSLRSLLCLPAEMIVDQFVEDVSFEAAVVDSILGFPETENSMREYTEINVWESEALTGLKPSTLTEGEIVLLNFPSVLKPPPGSVIDPANEVVIITGGLGALGLRVAEWLIAEGALNLVLLNRRGAVSSEVAAASPAWSLLMSNKLASNVRCIACDVTNLQSVEEVVARLCVKNQLRVVGIIHAAGVLRDKQMSLLSSDDIQSVSDTKIVGLQNLDAICDKYRLDRTLKFFTAFSSATAVIGNANQTAYAMANAAMSEIMAKRRRQGLIGQVIEWGPWSGEGMAEHFEGVFSRLGIKGISVDLGLRVLADALVSPTTDFTCIPLDAPAFIQSRPRKWNFYEGIMKQVQQSGSRKLIPEKLSRMSETELYANIRQVILETASKVIGNGKQDLSQIPTDVPLTDAGVDSLAAVEFRDEVSRQLGVSLSVSAMFDYPALDNLVDYVYETVRLELGAHSSVIQKDGAPKIFLTRPMGDRAAEGYAVLGLACRMPQGGSIPAFWQMLCNACDCVVEMPLSRFNLDHFYSPDTDKPGCAYTRAGAFMADVDVFDNLFFGISDAEAKLMDPQQRLMLEVTYDAVVDAGLDSKQLRKQFKDTAVYIGCCNFDWHYMDSNNNPKSGSPFSCTGGSMSLVSNRISYAFGLNGPSMTIDTACSSSLVALDAGREKLDSGNCSGLIVGGVNLMLSPQLFIGFCKTRLLSPDCACRTLDHRANGYVRGEGAAALFLLPMSNVPRTDGRRVYAVVKGSATNHVGRGSTLTAPNGPAQAACIKEALERSGKSPGDVCFLEMHGTGTEIGDPIEAGAIKTVYRDRGDKNNTLYLGAVKTNIGHLEGAAGVAGLIKSILVLHYRAIPPNLHFEKLSPHIDFSDCNFAVPAANVVDVNDQVPTTFCAAVSGFGFGGANAHVIVESVPKHSTNQVKSAVLLFTGQGSTYAHMGQDLMKASCTFRDSMLMLDQVYQNIIVEEAFLEVFGPHLSPPGSILSLIYDSAPSTPTAKEDVSTSKPISVLESDPLAAQVSVLMIELSLMAMIEEMDEIRPKAVLGHSIGEFAVLRALRMLPAADIIRIAVWRACLIRSRCASDNQNMVACKSTIKEAIEAIELCGLTDQVAVAAENGLQRVVLSGRTSAIETVLETLNVRGEHKELAISRAYHSPLMLPAEPEWKRIVETHLVNHLAPPTDTEPIAVYSTVTGTRIDPSMLMTVDYWMRHLTDTVLFHRAVESFMADFNGGETGPSLLIEVGPKGLLTRMMTAIQPATRSMFECHALENDPGLDGLKRERHTKSHLWNRRRHAWSDGPHHPTAGQGQKLYDGSISFKTHIRRDVVNLFREHIVADVALIPATGYLDMICAQTAQLNSKRWRSSLTKVEKMDFLLPSLLPMETPKREDLFKPAGELTVIYRADGSFEIYHATNLVDEDDKERLVCAGKVLLKPGVTEDAPSSPLTSPKTELVDNGDTLPAVMRRIASAVADSVGETATEAWSGQEGSQGALVEALKRSSGGDADEMFRLMAEESTLHIQNLYDKLAKRGLKYGPRFQPIRRIVCSDNEVLAFCQALSGEEAHLREEYPNYAPDAFDLDAAFRWHPAMLDGAFQAVAPLCRSANHVYVPSSLRHAYLKGVLWSEVCDGYWAHSTLLSRDDASICISVCIYSATSEEKIAFINDMRFKKLTLSPSFSIPQNLLWITHWKELRAEAPPKIDKTSEVTSTSLAPISESEVLSDGAANQAFVSLMVDKQTIYCVGNAPLPAAEYSAFSFVSCPKTQWVRCLTEESPERVFIHFDLRKPYIAKSSHDLAIAYSSATFFLQTCFEVKSRVSTRLLILGTSDQGVEGFVKTVNAEIAASPIANRLTVIALEFDKDAGVEIAAQVENYLSHRIDLQEHIIRFTRKEDLVLYPTAPRLQRLPTFEYFGPSEIWMGNRGSIANLKLKPFPDQSRLAPGPDEVELAVLSVGLNFRDVLNVMDLYPGDPGAPGADCAGIITRAGHAQTRFRIGDAAFGLAPGSLKAFVTCPAALLGHLPAGWSFEEAASLPVAQITVEYAFTDLVGLDRRVPQIQCSSIETSLFRSGGFSRSYESRVYGERTYSTKCSLTRIRDTRVRTCFSGFSPRNSDSNFTSSFCVATDMPSTSSRWKRRRRFIRRPVLSTSGSRSSLHCG
eukprot:Gregarina_sp_Poly_1__11130@NODE_8_length_24379_cov_62_925633_g7_i0_p1_GENE_NODE_8_length_24379_cov_62_925633_g7_i0NODE_8_length_24379_cov_62_925633_g7_i0_p1_ORF_typecomplete_len4339_score613_89ketoacylsynt/PF00109_26/1_7e74ketoacylsynt/PF00109_26/2_5e79AMPbinding/PF00501_28/8_1e82AMPbinding/PF00501_28/2_8e03Ketoacylsynt_C/PF02801_22/4_4e34Ketoacylsynt_C/PF02801_22/3_3e41PSDH/PF14765_6/7_3e34PSDH/PF14765_6/1e29Acyl_transf_1/PF00698_21/2_5e55KR/PF08659_10/2_2e47KAsynt_C_assoc/PF16197_5/3_7e10KAsyn